MTECFICLQKCVIPIQLQGYECFSGNDMNCNSRKRICVKCYTQKKLDICSFCRSKRKNNNIMIDFDSIYNDTFSILSCPFCKEFQGDHFALYKHLKDKCLEFCTCGDIFLKKDAREQFKNCKEKRWCEICKEFVKECSHKYCSICFSTDHEEKMCLKRTVKCRECNKEKNVSQIIEHYMEHIEESKKRTNFYKEELSREKKKYQRMMIFLPDLYKEVYHEDF